VSINAREVVGDAVKLVVGVGTFELVDPTFSKIPAGWLISLVVSVAASLFLSWLAFNQSEVHFAFKDEDAKLTLNGPTADIAVTAHSYSKSFILDTSWSGTGPFAAQLMRFAIRRAGFAFSVTTHSTLAGIVLEKGDGHQPRHSIRYRPLGLATDGVWHWSRVTVSTDELPETTMNVGVDYIRHVKSWRWSWLYLFIHLDPEITKFRLIGSPR